LKSDWQSQQADPFFWDKWWRERVLDQIYFMCSFFILGSKRRKPKYFAL